MSFVVVPLRLDTETLFETVAEGLCFSIMERTIGPLHQGARELLRKGQHGIAGKCRYVREKNKFGHYLITPHAMSFL